MRTGRVAATAKSAGIRKGSPVRYESGTSCQKKITILMGQKLKREKHPQKKCGHPAPVLQQPGQPFVHPFKDMRPWHRGDQPGHPEAGQDQHRREQPLAILLKKNSDLPGAQAKPDDQECEAGTGHPPPERVQACGGDKMPAAERIAGKVHDRNNRGRKGARTDGHQEPKTNCRNREDPARPERCRKVDSRSVMPLPVPGREPL
jgi:hypothetical protein